jgi:UDP-GlcNAc:undecaprenyl-phosphate GlcNAc-1-phosphate transferase
MTTDIPVSIFRNVALGLIFAIVAGLIAIEYARTRGIMDTPNKEPHKLHNQPIPIAGGIALFLVLLCGWLVNQKDFGDLWKVLLPALAIFVMGILDDFYYVRIWVKLAVEIFAASVLISFGIQVHAVHAIFAGIPLSVANVIDVFITIFWLVAMTNAYNFVDSMDGLALGIAVITSIFLAFTSLFSGQLNLALFMVFLAGACYGLYYFNSFPARLFMGDSGALSLGFLLSATSLLYNSKVFPQPSSWFVPIMILGVPIFDVVLVIISRFRRGRPIYQADRGHTYHRLVAIGVQPNQAVIILHIMSLLLGCLAFIAMNLPPVISNAIFIGTILAGVGLIVYLDDRRRWS